MTESFRLLEERNPNQNYSLGEGKSIFCSAGWMMFEPFWHKKRNRPPDGLSLGTVKNKLVGGFFPSSFELLELSDPVVVTALDLKGGRLPG
jgi:hypothetical protein